jgi:prophage antirepressor-like protein
VKEGNHMSNIQLYNFDTDTIVRSAYAENGDPVLCATDLAKAIGIKNTAQAFGGIDEEFKVICSTDTPGGKQDMVYLTEAGVYELMGTVRLRKQNEYYERIKAFRKWIYSEVLVSIRKTGKYDPQEHQSPAVATQLGEKKAVLKECIEIAQLMGFEGNQVLLTANKGVKHYLGCDLMAEFALALPSPDNATLLTPTQIAKLWESHSGQKKIHQNVNQRLHELGMQVRFDGVWRLTDKGKQHGVYLDVNKAYSDGTPVQQVKWKESVVPLVLGIN